MELRSPEVANTAAEYYVGQSLPVNLQELKDVHAEIAEKQAQMADLNREMEILQTHRLAIVFTIEAAKGARTVRSLVE